MKSISALDKRLPNIEIDQGRMVDAAIFYMRQQERTDLVIRF